MRRNPPHALASVGVREGLTVTAETYIAAELGVHDLPGVTFLQPLVDHLDLRAATNLLIEDAEFIADPVTDGGELERCERVHVAGSEAPEAAVAEARFLFQCEQLVEILIEGGHGRTRVRGDVEAQQVVAQLRAHQELCREVTHYLDVALRIGPRGGLPALEHPVAHAE